MYYHVLVRKTNGLWVGNINERQGRVDDAGRNLLSY